MVAAILKTMNRLMHSPKLLLVTLGLVFALTGCHKTGKLSPSLETRFQQEGIVRRADDLSFRRTIPPGQRDSGWSDKRASIIVTKESVFLHVNGKPLVEITPRSTGFYDVHREADRLSLHAGSGKSALSWSFHPPDDADGWTTDIRTIIKIARHR